MNLLSHYEGKHNACVVKAPNSGTYITLRHFNSLTALPQRLNDLCTMFGQQIAGQSRLER